MVLVGRGFTWIVRTDQMKCAWLHSVPAQVLALQSCALQYAADMGACMHAQRQSVGMGSSGRTVPKMHFSCFSAPELCVAILQVGAVHLQEDPTWGLACMLPNAQWQSVGTVSCSMCTGECMAVQSKAACLRAVCVSVCACVCG